MGNRSLFNLFCIVTLTAAHVGVNSGAEAALRISRDTPVEAVICPDLPPSAPCSCRYFSKIGITCAGSRVDEQVIERVLSEVRRVNKIPQDHGVYMDSFILSDTSMEQLDLAPFYGSRFDDLNFVANPGLTKVVTSGNSADYGSIHAFHTSFGMSPLLKREGLGDALKYYSTELSEFVAFQIDLVENDENTEFLPGLSAFTNLTSLDLALNNINRLHSGAFKGLQRLEYLNVGENDLNYIGEGALDFSPDGAQDDDQVVDPNLELDIYLGSNGLNETSFHPNSGLLSKSRRRTTLKFIQNGFSTIPSDIFLSFLEGHPQNFVEFDTNPIVCDQRLSWLKERRDDFESKLRANCQGSLTSIFDSDLVP